MSNEEPKYYVYCPSCNFTGIDVPGVPCPNCGDALLPDQVDE